ncbi:molybdopterin-dependent oxidoreductase [Nocardia sp. NBC_00416]|uniref:molybdopterin-dependent oxidoreductase n=1 Tax=Nocardia sp. NBC_00416 TaxID=2975991 RepID=UPI002E1F3E6F
MTGRGPQVASRVGRWLGAAIVLCFLTGLLSHLIQHPPAWFWWPANPAWLYRVTQGTHVLSGIAAVPLVLVKLWAVYPRLFARPILGGPRRALERLSIAVLVGSVLFQLATGLSNIAQFYWWDFYFPAAHYAMAYLAVGALAVHLAVKLPVIRAALRARPPVSSPPEPAVRLSRRAALAGAGTAAVAAVLSVAGQSVGFLRPLAVLAPRSGAGPQGLPVNRTAARAGIEKSARDPAYRLTVAVGDQRREFTRAELLALPQTTARLPIACVEGWSATADWTGVRLRDLLAAVGGVEPGEVRFESLETAGVYRISRLPRPHAVDDRTLVALALNGETLDLDHGYPCRLIAPNRPGVLQTKWLSRIEVIR